LGGEVEEEVVKFLGGVAEGGEGAVLAGFDAFGEEAFEDIFSVGELFNVDLVVVPGVD
jgi:hypothetical protein